MIQRQEQLRDHLIGSILEGREIVAVPVLDTGTLAFAVPIDSSEVEAAWRAARALLSETGLWPIASTFWSAGGLPFSTQVLEEDFFNRFYYAEVPGCEEVSPESICMRVKDVDVSRFLDDKEFHAEEEYGLDEFIESELDEVENRCGERPDMTLLERSLVAGERIRTSYQLERWLYDYEHARGFRSEPEESRQEWFTNDPSVLLFLPTRSGWEALAYLHWYGASGVGSEYYIALGKTWEERFGAELVSHYGTMLQCIVNRPPRNADEAFPLAREHNIVSPCTLALPGILLRDYADALVDWDRWFLHERP